MASNDEYQQQMTFKPKMKLVSAKDVWPNTKLYKYTETANIEFKEVFPGWFGVHVDSPKEYLDKMQEVARIQMQEAGKNFQKKCDDWVIKQENGTVGD